MTINMNISRYSYNENVKNDFIQFLKEANEAKNNIYCNIEKYKQIKKLFPLQDEIKQDLQMYMENANICIDITQSDEETQQICKPVGSNKVQILDELDNILSTSFHDLDHTNIRDIVDSIRDSLSIKNELSIELIKDLSNLENSNLDKVFSSLMCQINLENLESFWNSLMVNNIKNEYVILCYMTFLILPRVRQEFTYELQTIFVSLSKKYSIVLKNELVKELLKTDPKEKEAHRVLQQYIGTLDNDFKSEVLSHFLFKCEKLHPNYITTIEVLLNPQSDYDTLTKLIEMMSNAATEFSNDNSYGKLLFNVINLFERDMCRLEQPLKHILGIHRSIWKLKVQKSVLAWFDESLTQSFI